MEFASARQEAYEFISRLYAVRPVHIHGPDRPLIQWIISVEIEIEGNVCVLDLKVLLPEDFPLALPKVYLEPQVLSAVGTLPNVGGDGFVCTFDEAATQFDPTKPGELVAAVIERARGLIELHLRSPSPGAFEDEFVAYWRLSGGAHGKLIKVLGIIDNDPGCNELTVLNMTTPIGGYKFAVVDTGQSAARFREWLHTSGTGFSEYPALFIGELDPGQPPFDWDNTRAVEMVVQSRFQKAFRTHLDENPHPAVVVFSKRIDDRAVYLGWVHPTPNLTRKGFRQKSMTPYRIISGVERTRRVTRLWLEPYTRARLESRTAGRQIGTRLPRVAVVGLGSIGSNLIPFLYGGLASELGLLDPDELSVENIGRHFLGFSFVGRNKADAMKAYLHDRDPLFPVSVLSRNRLAHALESEPRLLDDFERIIIAAGDTPTEIWFSEKVSAKEICKPTVFLWVEPYMAGGHVVYLCPGSCSLSPLFSDGIYRYSVIHPSEYSTNHLLCREPGCQTTFTPYAHGGVLRYLSAIYPHLADALVSEDCVSFRLTWCGDKTKLPDTIQLSDFGSGLESESIKRERLE